MYEGALALHNLLRWLVVMLALGASLDSLVGWLCKKEWQAADRRLALVFTLALDVQVALGLSLYYFFSPLTQNALNDLGAVMRDPLQRYFAVEHPAMMILALILAHLGAVLARKRQSHLPGALLFTLAALLILLGTPWPFSRWPRPWLPAL
jgi:hypothetical protein